MSELEANLATRREEFEEHFAIAKALEDWLVLGAQRTLGSVSLSARHINATKSGLIVHLYNIEEALMSQVLDLMGREIGSVEPRQWSEHSLREWLRESIVSRITDGSEDGRLKKVFESSTKLLSSAAPGPQKLKKPPGTWDDKAIAKFAKRMNVTFDLQPEMRSKIAPNPQYGDKTPLQFLADRRNAIAHGRRSFEEAANDLSLQAIEDLANITFDYLACAASAFNAHIEDAAHLVPA
jgi:hypothetical protein